MKKYNIYKKHNKKDTLFFVFILHNNILLKLSKNYLFKLEYQQVCKKG